MTKFLTIAFLSFLLGFSVGVSPVKTEEVKIGQSETKELANLFELHNKYRTDRKCNALTTNIKLQNAAQKHSEWMARNNKMSHVGKDGSRIETRVTQEGYHFKACGENVAMGQSSSNAVMNTWINSDGHRKNILNERYQEVGVGVAANKNGTLYWTVVFGTENKPMEVPLSADKREALKLNYKVRHLEDNPKLTLPVTQLKYYQKATTPGWEERSPEWWYLLQCEVRVGGGSATIIYQDSNRMTYLVSCGHLFSDRKMTREQSKKNPKHVKVQVYYQNNKKLEKFKEYTAEVLCYENFNESIYDVSLIRFQADWILDHYIPIGAKDTQLIKDQRLHSLGCDGRSPPARYDIRYIKEVQRGQVTEFISNENSPRRGRSGGGVILEDNGVLSLVGICSRGDDIYGYWSSLQQIHRFLENEPEFRFLLDVKGLDLRKIPIITKIGPIDSEEKVPVPY